MSKLSMIAIHEIQRPGAKKGPSEIIAPGSKFEASSEEEFKSLSRGAARPAKASEAEAEADAGDENKGDENKGDDLSKLSVKDLRAKLTEQNIAFETSDNQAKLIALLAAAAEDNGI